MSKTFFAVSAALITSLISTSGYAQTLIPATVFSTGDGDTLRVQRGGDRITVRLACVDAPERKQAGGKQSAERLKALLPRGTAVQLRVVDKDRYKRTVAEIFKGGQSINLQLVKEGFAIIYPQYFDNCRDSERQYLQAQSRAKQARRGFWSQATPIMPWDWRQRNR